MKIANGKDFWAGAMFMAFGLGFMIVAQDYSMGTAVRMGPAYFPSVLGGMMALLGLVILLMGVTSRENTGWRAFPFRPLVFIGGLVIGIIAYYTQDWGESSTYAEIMHLVLSGIGITMMFAAFGPKSLWVILSAVMMFGYLLKPLGLVVAAAVLVFVSAWGGHEFKVKEVVIVYIILAVFSVFAFVHGLGLPMNVWPEFLE